MRVGLLVTGDTSVRAAHSLQAHPGIDEVVVVGPAKSKSFRVVDSAEGCDVLLGTGSTAPDLARRNGVPLVWDGDHTEEGIAVWAASPQGLAISLASRESDPQLVAVAHPMIQVDTTDRTTRFPDPIGRVGVGEAIVGDRPIAIAHSPNDFAACLAVGAARRVTIVDHGAFMSGIALAAGVAALDNASHPVWDSALSYLEAVTEMGLVMAESE